MKILKNIITTTILATLITTSSPAISFGSGFTPDFDIDCSNGGLFSFLDLGDDICSSADGFLGALNGDFSFGGCSLEVGGDTDCYLKSIKSACTGGADSMVIDPLKSAVTSVSEFDLLKGDGFKSSAACGEEKKLADAVYPSGWTQRDIYSSTNSQIMMKKRHNPFSSSIDSVRDCMKLNGEACLEPGAIKLPATSLDVEKKIMESAHSIAQADQSSAANMASVEAETRTLLDACNLLPAELQELCERGVKEGDKSPQAQATKEIAKLELASSIELALIKKASRGDTYYVYKNKDFVKKLPRELRADYADGVARQNAADTLIISLYAELIGLKKEAIRANYADTEASATPYSAGGGVDALANNFGLNGTGDANGGTVSGTENLTGDFSSEK